MSNETSRIRTLNDAFRKSPHDRSLGRTYTTDGVQAQGPDFVARALVAVAGFDAFDGDNDPWHEHDFGALDIDGVRVFWKIDYYDRNDPDLGSENPADQAVTERVMTLMLAEEY